TSSRRSSGPRSAQAEGKTERGGGGEDDAERNPAQQPDPLPELLPLAKHQHGENQQGRNGQCHGWAPRQADAPVAGRGEHELEHAGGRLSSRKREPQVEEATQNCVKPTPVHLPAVSSNSLSGDRGISVIGTPIASSIADPSTAPTGITPASPAPLIPSGFSGDGVSMWSISMGGIPVASSPGCSPSSSGGPGRGLAVNWVAASVPPPNAYRTGFASTETAARGMPRLGAPLTRTWPPASSRSAASASR